MKNGNNQVTLTGRIATEFKLCYQYGSEKFYKMEIVVKRLSENVDWIPVVVSDWLVDITQDYTEQFVEIHGEFRSHNCHEEMRNRLELFVFAREVNFIKDSSVEPLNEIYLNGYICKSTIYRKTPLGREITDLLLAVNRFYGKTDYIPCICWGRNARYASSLEVGCNLFIWGRIQNREYIKQLAENKTQKRTAYEVSICKLDKSLIV